MTDHSEPSPPCDVHLLLRAHAYQHWLSREVVPVVRELQQPRSLPTEQLGVALAYLEVLWIEASRRAAETDAAYAELDACSSETDGASASGDGTLQGMIRRYHEAVRSLHDCIARRVSELLGGCSDPPTREQVGS
jgi:hypothetical protein